MKKQLQETFYNLESFTWKTPELAVMGTKLGDDRCIITWSKTRAERDWRAKEEALDIIKTGLSSKKPLSKKFITNRSYKKYLTVKGETQCILKP